MPLVTTEQFKTPSILSSIQQGLRSRGEIQRQAVLTREQENFYRLQALAEERAAEQERLRKIYTGEVPIGDPRQPEPGVPGQIAPGLPGQAQFGTPGAKLGAVTQQAETQQLTPEQAMMEHWANDPEGTKKVLESLDIATQEQKEDGATFGSQLLLAESPDDQRKIVINRIRDLNAKGRDSSQTLKMFAVIAEDEAAAPGTPSKVKSASLALKTAALTELQRDKREARMEARMEKTKAAATKSKVAGSIVQSAEILPDGSAILVMKDGSTKVETLKDTAKRQVKTARTYGAEIQGLRSGERESGKGAIKIGHAAFNKLAPIRKNISNLRRGIQLLDKGANTGPVMKHLATFKSATVELKNLQAQLGLDIIGDVTFGALSESELKFALDTAIPEGLNEPELKEWLMRKVNTQSKLYDAYEEAALYLGTPGNNVPGYVRKRQEGRTEEAKVQGRPKVGDLIQGAPAIGTVDAGYRYKGGDPSQQSSWEEVR